MGFAVIEMASGEGLYEQIVAHQPVACLLDIIMDEGYESIIPVAKMRNRPKLITVSSNRLCLDFTLDMGVEPPWKTGQTRCPRRNICGIGYQLGLTPWRVQNEITKGPTEISRAFVFVWYRRPVSNWLFKFLKFVTCTFCPLCEYPDRYPHYSLLLLSCNQILLSRY